MTDRYWKSQTAPWRRQRMGWPSVKQLAGQAVLIGLTGLVWAGLLAGYLYLVGPGGEEISQQNEVEPRPVLTEEASPVPIFSPSATLAPATATPAPGPTRSPVSAPVTVVVVSPTPTGPPGSPATVTPLPLPTPTSQPTSEPAAPAAVSFSADVLPVLEQRCIKCHGGEKTEEGLVLKSYADLITGSWNGPVIKPGSAAESYLVELITSGKMPKNNPRLLPGEIRTISAWINSGAPDN